MKKSLIAATILLFILVVAYTAAWHGWARGVAQAIDNFRSDMALQDTVIDGTFSKPSGFPGPITVSFSGTVASDGRSLTIPTLTVRGFFLPGTNLRIDMPQGLQLQLPDRDLYTTSIDAAVIDVTVPNPLPADFRAPDLNNWRERGGKLDIHELSLRKGDLNVTGHGTLTLDQRLQPVLEMPSQVTGHMNFVADLQKRGLIDTRNAIIAAGALSLMSKPDENNMPTLTGTIAVKQSTLYVGLFRIVDVPPLFWPE